MILVKTLNDEVEKFPYTIKMLREDNPQTSFPKRVSDAILQGYGVFHVMPESQPEHNPLTEFVLQDAIPRKETRVKQDGDEGVDDVSVGEVYQTGRWVIGYSVKQLPLEQAERNIRSRRDGLLQETDWVVIMHTEKGTNIPMEWELYRQALRDITAQAGFPYSVEWPTKP